WAVGLKRDDDGVRFVISRRSRDGIDAYPDHATNKDVAGDAGHASPGNLSGQLDRLRLISRFLDGDANVGVALHDNRAGRHAARRVFEPGNDGFGAWRR